MFQKACKQVHRCLYGIFGVTQTDERVRWSAGTAFMIAPGILATAAHITRPTKEPSCPGHERFDAICALDMGESPEVVTLLAEDPHSDIALFRVENSRHHDSVMLDPERLPLGTPCGTLGYPFSFIAVTDRLDYGLKESFRSAYISSTIAGVHPDGTRILYYLVDAPLYEGSSGSPGFIHNGHVVGIAVQSQFDSCQDAESLPTETLAELTHPKPHTILPISLWVPAAEIIKLAQDNRIVIRLPAK